MKYAREVIEIMAAYPKRRFRILELVRHATRGRTLSKKEKEAVRKAIKRVLEAMLSNGTVKTLNKSVTQGQYIEYSIASIK